MFKPAFYISRKYNMDKRTILMNRFHKFVYLRNAKKNYMTRNNLLSTEINKRTFKHMALGMTYANERGGTPMHTLTCFLIFSRYFISEIVKSVRKISLRCFKMRQDYLSTPYWCQWHISLLHFAHSGDILTPVTTYSTEMILSHLKIM